MKIGFLTFEQYHGKKDIGSSRIRCDWLIKYWKEMNGIGEAERFKFGRKYDVVIFQKAYFTKYAEAFKGIKILDICDADWLDWSYNIKEMIDLCDAVTCSTPEIAFFISQLTDKPIVVIPDRVDFGTLPEPKVHEGQTLVLGWFGYSDNFSVLESAIPALVKRKLSLIVVSDKSFVTSQKGIEIQNFPWNPATWVGDIMRADVIINPKSKIGRFKYKSDNKTIQAQALGLPVAHDDKELDALMTAEARNEEAKKKYDYVKSERDVKQSVGELTELIKDIYAEKGTDIPS